MNDARQHYEAKRGEIIQLKPTVEDMVATFEKLVAIMKKFAGKPSEFDFYTLSHVDDSQLFNSLSLLASRIKTSGKTRAKLGGRTSRVDAIRREIRVSWRCMLEHPEYGLRGFLENCDEIEK
ncbi:MAG: hypothetical protein ACTSU9_07875, partial [Promethearchaeota archaeon]